METEREKQALAIDKEDLLAILNMRFGGVPEEIHKEIGHIDQLETLERLIPVAANVPTWETFVKELREGKDSFKLVGQMYDPLANPQKEE